MIPYQWTTAVIGILLAVFIISLVRRDLLHTKYSVWWFVVALSVVILGIFPRLSDSLANFFGVSYPPSLIFIVGACFLLLKMLTMDLDRSRLEVQIRRLTQRLAMLEDQVEKSTRKGGDEAQ